MIQVFAATGRRKSAVARVQLSPGGSGRIQVNGRPFEEYFPTAALQIQVLQPLQATNQLKSFDVTVKAHGGGPMGQAGAVKMAIARALTESDVNLRPTLKTEGLLTRDPREKERKKSGQPGARKRFQFSKR
jgi:small subunit ribosomal protein S9